MIRPTHLSTNPDTDAAIERVRSQARLLPDHVNRQATLNQYRRQRYCWIRRRRFSHGMEREYVQNS